MSDKTLFIHAGGSKTGSSALQVYLKINASQLESHGFAYKNCHSPEFGSNNGMFLYTLLSREATDNELKSMVLSYFGHCNNAICSSEYFQLLDARGWRKLYKLSVKLGLNLKKIFYFRDVLPFFLSSYDQSI